MYMQSKRLLSITNKQRIEDVPFCAPILTMPPPKAAHGYGTKATGEKTTSRLSETGKVPRNTWSIWDQYGSSWKIMAVFRCCQRIASHLKLYRYPQEDIMIHNVHKYSMPDVVQTSCFFTSKKHKTMTCLLVWLTFG